MDNSETVRLFRTFRMTEKQFTLAGFDMSIYRVLLLLLLPHFLFAQSRMELWPEVDVFNSGHLRVSDLHELYFEQCGNPNGPPVFVLHGGPGGNISPYYRRFCDPAYFHIILHDQRGAGKSRPWAEIRENTTWDLVEDIERLRTHLNVDEIILFGGSWGTTLALAYAEQYPDHVAGLILRGVFTATQEEIDHFYHGGLAKLFPDLYQDLLDELPDPQRRPLPAYLFELLTKSDSLEQVRYARAWTRYEAMASRIDHDDSHRRNLERWLSNNNPLSFALFENYYMANRCFFEEGQLLRDLQRITHIPAWIVNGRFDVICPPITAWRLHRLLPRSELRLTYASGHSMGEKNTEIALMEGFEWMRRQLDE